MARALPSDHRFDHTRWPCRSGQLLLLKRRTSGPRARERHRVHDSHHFTVPPSDRPWSDGRHRGGRITCAAPDSLSHSLYRHGPRYQGRPLSPAAGAVRFDGRTMDSGSSAGTREPLPTAGPGIGAISHRIAYAGITRRRSAAGLSPRHHNRRAQARHLCRQYPAGSPIGSPPEQPRRRPGSSVDRSRAGSGRSATYAGQAGGASSEH